jgi:hypothetical protein
VPSRIPIKAASEIAKKYDCRQVIVLAWDGKLTHVVTFGKSVEDCAQAAAGGNTLKAKWGWPESNDQPSLVAKLEDCVRELMDVFGDSEYAGRERIEKILRLK